MRLLNFLFKGLKRLNDRLETNTELLLLILQNQKSIMGKQQEAADKLLAIGAQLSKANQEIQLKIQQLQDAANNADNVSPELQAAIDDLAPAAQALDDVVPDVADPGDDTGEGDTGGDTGGTGTGDTGTGDTGTGGTGDNGTPPTG